MRISKKIAGVAFLGALTLATTVAFAQDYIYSTFQWGFKPYVIPGVSEACGASGLMGPAQPLVYDKSAWLFVTCADGRVQALRFYHPADNATPPAPLTPPASAPTMCDSTVMIGATGMNECEWRARYPVR